MVQCLANKILKYTHFWLVLNLVILCELQYEIRVVIVEVSNSFTELRNSSLDGSTEPETV